MINNKDFIVSCQALENEPLHSSFIMGKMALAALQGGANGIRANSIADIKEIKKNTNLPIIGIIKNDYPDSNVYITPTMREIDALVEEKIEVIALDATNQIRPGNLDLITFFKQVKEKYPNQLFMADCSTFEEMQQAEKLGFDYIGTTLFGYTKYSKEAAFSNIEAFKTNTQNITAKIIAEGQIHTPSQAKKIIELPNVFAIVIGGAITRPQNITQTFSDALRKEQ